MSQKGAREWPTPPRDLTSFLSQVRRRLWASSFLHNVAVDLIVATSLLVALVFLDRTFFPGIVTLHVSLGLVLASVLVSTLRTLLWSRSTSLETAALVDERLRLKERVSSTFYLKRTRNGEDRASEEEGRQEWLRLLEEDAARSIEKVSLRERFPVRMPRVFAWVLLPLVLSGALSLWLPSLDLLEVGGSREAAAREKKTISEEEEKLAERLEEIVRKAEAKNFPEAKKLLGLLAQQARQVETTGAAKAQKAAGNPRERAMVQMTRREDSIRNGLNGRKYQRLKEALEEMAGLDLKKPAVTRPLQDALKNGDLKKAQRELKKLQSEIEGLSGKKLSELTPEEKALARNLAEELKSLANNSKAFAGLSAALAEASSQLGGAGLSGAQAGLSGMQMDLQALALLTDEKEMLDQALKSVQASKAELGKPHKCPNCGKKLGKKPGGT